MLTPTEIRDRILSGNAIAENDLELSTALHPVVPLMLVADADLARGVVLTGMVARRSRPSGRPGKTNAPRRW